MASVGVSVDSRALRAGLSLVIRELKLQDEAHIEEAGEKIADRARMLAPKRTRALVDSIRVTPLIREGARAFVEVVAGGPGIRETIFMEFGSVHASAQPFMRPAAAAAAGILRSAGASARLASSNRAKLFGRRAKARAAVRERQRAGLLSPIQARAASRGISQRLRYRNRRRG